VTEYKGIFFNKTVEDWFCDRHTICRVTNYFSIIAGYNIKAFVFHSEKRFGNTQTAANRLPTSTHLQAVSSDNNLPALPATTHLLAAASSLRILQAGFIFSPHNGFQGNVKAYF
jgi:hypothetical protein